MNCQKHFEVAFNEAQLTPVVEDVFILPLCNPKISNQCEDFLSNPVPFPPIIAPYAKILHSDNAPAK